VSNAFYWYPDPAGTLETLTLSAALKTDITELQEGEAGMVAGSVTAGGTHYRVLFGLQYAVRVEIDRVSFNSEATRRTLRNMLNHLHRGGYVGFAADASKAWGSFVAVPPGGPVRGATSIVGLQRQAWYSTTASLASGDAIVIETGSPQHIVEETTTSATVANSATSLSCASILTTFGGACHVRHRDFYPILLMEPAEIARANKILSAKRLWYDIALDFIYDLSGVMALSGPGPVVRQAGGSKFTGQSLESGLAAALNNGGRGFGGFNG
jgi:hypothetical protein